MKRATLILMIIILFEAIGYAQVIDSSDIEIDFGTDSLYNLQLELKAKQGNLSDCEFGIENANNDFKKNVFSIHSIAFSGNCSYCAVLKQDYNINWYFKNDLFSEEYYHCYDSIMRENLIEKYKYDIFKSALIKVDSLEKTNNWISDAEYIGGQNELLNFILTRLTIDSTDIKDGIKTKLYIELEIDTTGKAINPIIRRGFDKRIEKELNQIIDQMPKWKPAYLYGQPVRQKYLIPLNLDYQ